VTIIYIYISIKLPHSGRKTHSSSDNLYSSRPPHQGHSCCKRGPYTPRAPPTGADLHTYVSVSDVICPPVPPARLNFARASEKQQEQEEFTITINAHQDLSVASRFCTQIPTFLLRLFAGRTRTRSHQWRSPAGVLYLAGLGAAGVKDTIFSASLVKLWGLLIPNSKQNSSSKTVRTGLVRRPPRVRKNEKKSMS